MRDLKFPLVESLFETIQNGYHIRVWIQEDDLNGGNFLAVKKQVTEIIAYPPYKTTEVIRSIARIEHVNAVQVKYKDFTALIGYTKWP